MYSDVLNIDFRCSSNPDTAEGLTITGSSMVVKPFTMYGLAWLFMKVIFKNMIAPELANQYLAGAILLGAAPCTAMVFVWSYLMKGNPAYTLVQVAANDLVILAAFTPIVAFLLGISDVKVPFDTLLLSVVLFVLIPLAAAFLTRKLIVRRKGVEALDKLSEFSRVPIAGLLLTSSIIFSFMGRDHPVQSLHILYIAVPLVIQTFLILGIAYGWAKALETAARHRRSSLADRRVQLLRACGRSRGCAIRPGFRSDASDGRRRPRRSSGDAHAREDCERNSR